MQRLILDMIIQTNKQTRNKSISVSRVFQRCEGFVLMLAVIINVKAQPQYVLDEIYLQTSTNLCCDVR